MLRLTVATATLLCAMLAQLESSVLRSIPAVCRDDDVAPMTTSASSRIQQLRAIINTLCEAAKENANYQRKFDNNDLEEGDLEREDSKRRVAGRQLKERVYEKLINLITTLPLQWNRTRRRHWINGNRLRPSNLNYDLQRQAGSRKATTEDQRAQNDDDVGGERFVRRKARVDAPRDRIHGRKEKWLDADLLRVWGKKRAGPPFHA